MVGFFFVSYSTLYFWSTYFILALICKIGLYSTFYLSSLMKLPLPLNPSFLVFSNSSCSWLVLFLFQHFQLARAQISSIKYYSLILPNPNPNLNPHSNPNPRGQLSVMLPSPCFTVRIVLIM